MSYIGKSPTQGVRSRYYFTATGGETSLSGADDNGVILIFTDGAYVDVYLNGVLLVAGTDYNTTTTNTIGGIAALAASDIVEIIVYDVFTLPDAVKASTGGTFSGTITATAFIGDGSSLTGVVADLVNDTTPQLGGDLDLNSSDITGTGNVSITGTVTATGDITAASFNGGGFGNRNLIINPSGAINQRGGSSTINAYSVDRWRSYGGPGGFTISQRTDAGEGDGYAIRFQRTASNTQTNNMGIAQGIETKDSKRLAGKTITVSFRARVGSDWSPTDFSVTVFHGTGTDENPVGMTGQGSLTAISNASLTTSFQTFTGTVTVPSGKTQITLGFSWTPSGTAGANEYVDIREVQLEVGEQATTFEYRSFGDELARCQRYFQKSYNLEHAPGNTTNNGAYQFFQPSSTIREPNVRYQTEMRVNPTETFYAPDSGTSGKVRNRSTNADETAVIGDTGSKGFNLSMSITANNHYGFHYTADAEL